VWAVLGLATELFCDLVGAMLMGPSFMISLYEISWAQNKGKWTISLSPYRSSAATKEEMENGVTSWDNVCDQTNMILREQTPCLLLQPIIRSFASTKTKSPGCFLASIA
jgi:hypothetical protein